MGLPRLSFRRLLDRVAHRRRGFADAESMPPDLRLPEQRLLDASARYARIVSGDGSGHRRRDAAAAGVRTVPPTDPSDADAPVWVRRLGDRTVYGSIAAEPEPVAMDPGIERPTVGSASSSRD